MLASLRENREVRDRGETGFTYHAGGVGRTGRSRKSRGGCSIKETTDRTPAGVETQVSISVVGIISIPNTRKREAAHRVTPKLTGDDRRGVSALRCVVDAPIPIA